MTAIAHGTTLSLREQWRRYDAKRRVELKTWHTQRLAENEHERARVQAMLIEAQQANARRYPLHTIRTKTTVAHIEGLLDDAGTPTTAVLLARYGIVMYAEEVLEGVWKGLRFRVELALRPLDFQRQLNEMTGTPHFSWWTSSLLCTLRDYGALWTNQPIGDRHLHLRGPV
jgi:hypothetical protein